MFPRENKSSFAMYKKAVGLNFYLKKWMMFLRGKCNIWEQKPLGSGLKKQKS
jgi:hypothetical protein